MAAVALRQRTSVSKTESLELVLCLVRSSLFQICYLRGLLPEEEFATKRLATLDNMRVQILVPRSPEGRRLIDWVESGAADALKRQYMKSLYFGVSSDAKGADLIEQYHFSVSYTDGGASVGVETTVGARQSTSAASEVLDAESARRELCKTMRMLVTVCEHLEDVPEERHVFMRMTYYDHAPMEYEPPFFGPAGAENLGRFGREPVVFNVGVLRTPHHQTKLQCGSVLERHDDTEDEGASARPLAGVRRPVDGRGRTRSLSLPVQPRSPGTVGSDVEMQDVSSGAAANRSGDLSVETDRCLSLRSVASPETDALKQVVAKVIELCRGETWIKVEDVRLALPGTAEEEIQKSLRSLVVAGCLVPTYRSNRFLVGDLGRSAEPARGNVKEGERRLQPPAALEETLPESLIASGRSLQGSAPGIFGGESRRHAGPKSSACLPAGSERTCSAFGSRESRCGNGPAAGFFAGAARSDRPAGRLPVGSSRKASFVEEPIARAKRPRTRIGKMRG